MSNALAKRGSESLYRMRSSSTKSRRGRGPSFKKLLAQGSVILDRLSVDPYYAQTSKDCWNRMEVAFHSISRADRRTALTCLQLLLAEWTAADAKVASDQGIQRFRKTLHLALDH